MFPSQIYRLQKSPIIVITVEHSRIRWAGRVAWTMIIKDAYRILVHLESRDGRITLGGISGRYDLHEIGFQSHSMVTLILVVLNNHVLLKRRTFCWRTRS